MTPLLSVVPPKQPNGPGWTKLSNPSAAQLASLGYPFQTWRHIKNEVFAISAVEVAHDPGAPDLGPEYHLSLSKNGERLSSADALWALAQFDLTDAKEDNHVPGGKVRNFWRPVADRLSGFECPCADAEPVMREDKGDYVWRGLS